MKTKPCAEPVSDGEPCGRKKTTRSNKWCYWHWLLVQPPSVQDEHVAARQRTVQLKRQEDFVCTSCGWSIPPFYKGRGTRCLGCESSAAHSHHVARTYVETDYAALFARQGGRCAVCGKRQVAKRPAVDHDHATGRTRGLLCQWCNERVLGSLGGDTVIALARARALVLYLEHPPASDPLWHALYLEPSWPTRTAREKESPGPDVPPPF